jgi:exodeoxyribonuclease-3
MRVISWNIQQGGGKRAKGIMGQLRRWSPDVVGLSEFRGTPPSQQISTGLKEMGLTHQVTTVDSKQPGSNGLLLASRFPIQQIAGKGPLHSLGRWIHVEINEPLPMHVITMHVPNRSEGPKYECHAWIVEFFQRHRMQSAMAMGDTNTGMIDLDEESRFFNRRESDWFGQISEAGWIDVWRDRNPSRREFTWRSSHGNGFRLDQLFASHAIERLVSSVEYDWGNPPADVRQLSDHAAIVIDVETRPKNEVSKEAKGQS